MTAQLRVTGLFKKFGDVSVVNGLDLDVQSGEFVALLGPSGCGKTTTLRMIAGLERADAGQIEIARSVVTANHRHVPAERRNIGLVFQEYALFPHLTIGQNVAYGLGRTRSRRTTVADYLTLVGLAGLENRYPRELSGGQQQRVALARALAPQPDILLLDEPFSNLDPSLRAQVRAEVREILRQSNCTSVLVTHDQEEALSMADRVAVMFDGQIVQCASPRTLYEQPANRAVASFVGDAWFVEGIARGKVIDTALGQLRGLNEQDGPVTALIRPEMIVILGADSPFGVEATITSSRFFGHDQLLTCQLTDGLRIESRIIGAPQHRTGDQVRLIVRGHVLSFSNQK